MTFVIVIAVMLVASVTTIIDSINQTVLTMYGYQRYFTVLTPRNTLSIGPSSTAAIKKVPHLQVMYPASALFMRIKTIFGKTPFAVFALRHQDAAAILKRCHIHLMAGRLPSPHQAEIALSYDIAANKHIKLGGVVMSPTSRGSFSPKPIRLVGILDGPDWFALTPRSFVLDNSPIAPNGYLVSARSVKDQIMLDKELKKALNPAHVHIWTYAGLVHDTSSALAYLYLILDIVVGIIIFDIAFLCGLLFNIYYAQRLPEFAVLLAMGYQRRLLIWRTLAETGLLSLIGWAIGAVLTTALLVYMQGAIFHPKGLLLNPYDIGAYRLTLPLPIAIAGFAVATIAFRLRSLDPVGIIERRQ